MKYIETRTIKNLLRPEFPIESGNGESPATAYVFRGIRRFEAPSLERMVIDITLISSGLENWKLISQAFTIINDREMDRLIIQTDKVKNITTYKFYFDLSKL